MDLDRLGELLSLASLPQHLAEVESRIRRAVRVENAYLEDPALRVASAGGKRLRPVLVLAAARIVGGDLTDGVFESAAAVELVHVGSLVHDDIMDQAATRRGVVTINAKEGASHALLVGDFLLARAAQMASTVNNAVSYELATAIADLCDGQSLETASCFDASRDRLIYERSIRGKTAALFRSSLRIGAFAAQGDERVTRSLGEFGTSFGMAFQIVDDVLDLVSSEAAMGKPVGNDIREGVYTLPLLLLRELEPAAVSKLGQHISPDDIGDLVTKMHEHGCITASLEVARAYNDAAVAALAPLADHPVAAGLSSLPMAYLDWALREKTEARYSLASS